MSDLEFVNIDNDTYERFKRALNEILTGEEIVRIYTYAKRRERKELVKYIAMVNAYGGAFKTPVIVLVSALNSADLWKSVLFYMGMDFKDEEIND